MELGGISWGRAVAVVVAVLSSSCTVLVLSPVVSHRWGLQMGKQLLQRMVFPRTGSHSPHVAVDASSQKHTWDSRSLTLTCLGQWVIVAGTLKSFSFISGIPK